MENKKDEYVEISSEEFEKVQALKKLEELRKNGDTEIDIDYREEYFKYLDERYQV